MWGLNEGLWTNTKWKMKRMFAKGPLQIEKWKLKSEKGVRRGNQKNWKLKRVIAEKTNKIEKWKVKSVFGKGVIQIENWKVKNEKAP